ncbi:MAG TPA: hypothetical protein VK436_07770 [Methanocella sp.]|nr:hypothetical protein [Methanocella sp.]
MVTSVPTIDPATAICCGGGICITILLVISIVSILGFYGLAAWLSWMAIKALGTYFKKDNK